MHKKKVTALVAAMSVCVAAFAGYTVYNVSQSTDSAIKQDIKEYLEEYSHTVNLDNNVLGDAGIHAENGYTLLTKDEVAELSDTVYSAISSNYTEGTPMTEEDITNIKEQVYNAVYNQLCDKTSTEVINNVYDNILAVCLDDLYMYADMKDATLKSALEAQLKVLANNLTDTSKRIDTAEADYNTLSVMLGEYKAETDKDYETMQKYYQALGNSLESVNGTIADNTISIKALQASNKETADKLNNLITSDLATGNDNQAMSAAAGKSLVETMTTYYLNNNKNIDQLSKDVAGNIEDIDIELANLNAGINSNKDNVSNLNNRADGIQNDINNLINELNNADSSTINNTINNITKELTELLVNQNTDVREVLNYLQNLYSSADEESRKLIQQLIVELSKTQADADINLVKLLQLLSEAQKAPDADTYNSIVNQMKELISNIQVSSPEVYNKLEQYLEKLYAGDTSVLNNIIDIISGTLVEHNANLSTYIKNMLSMIENSEFAGDQLFIDIVNKIRELQSFDTTSLQHSIYTSLHSLFISIGSDTETMYNAINEAMKEIGKANQDVFNQLNDTKNELSDDLAYTYYLLSTDLKITNEELTNEIYNNYLNLSTTAENNKEELTQALADAQRTLEESDAANKEELSLALQTAKDYLTSVDEQNAEAFNNALNTAQNALKAADAANKESLEKLVSDTNEALKTADAENKADLENQLKTARAELDAIDARNLQQLTKLSNDNKNELSANLAQAKKELEDSDLANKEELNNALTRAEEALKSDATKNKQELENALAEAQRLLTEADAANTDALNKALAEAQAKLEKDDENNKEALTQALADAQRVLVESDAANKEELINKLNNSDNLNIAERKALKEALEEADANLAADLSSATDALNKSISDEVAALVQADADNLQLLQNADVTINNNINQLMTDNSAKDAAQDVAIQQAKSKADEAFQFASDGKEQIADAITGRGVTSSNNMTFAELTANIDSIGNLATVGSEQMLLGAKAYVNGQYIDGSIPTKTVSKTDLVAGEEIVISKGYYANDTRVTVASLSTQTAANAPDYYILDGYTAYVNGNKITGKMPDNGALSVNLTEGSFTIPRGYHNGSGNVTITVEALKNINGYSATLNHKNQLLQGVTAYGANGTRYSGDIPVRDTINKELNAGQYVDVPAGYYPSAGKVSVPSLNATKSALASKGVTINANATDAQVAEAINKIQTNVTLNSMVGTITYDKHFHTLPNGSKLNANSTGAENANSSKGGCYNKENKYYHYHTENRGDGSGCYSLATCHWHYDNCYHSHTGSSNKDSSDRGCYTTAVTHTHNNECYHKHSGSPNAYGNCYTVSIPHSHSASKGCYHTHSGNSTSGGNCFGTPVYHKHKDGNGTVRDASYTTTSRGGCFITNAGSCDGTSTWTIDFCRNTPEGGNQPCNSDCRSKRTCNKCGGSTTNSGHQSGSQTCGATKYKLGCNKTTNTIAKYKLNCAYKAYTSGQVTNGNLICNKSVDGYSLGCTYKAYSSGQQHEGNTTCGYTNGQLLRYTLGCQYKNYTSGQKVQGNTTCGKTNGQVLSYSLGCDYRDYSSGQVTDGNVERRDYSPNCGYVNNQILQAHINFDN